MNEITIEAMAKINLGLDVVRRRPDGYHEVRMIMQMLHLHDDVSIRRTQEPGIHITTNLSFLPTNEDNIAYRAARMLMEAYDIREGVDIHIEKRIPVAAGMAGGSTNCAAVLEGVNKIFELGISDEALRDYGVKLGADVPYCLMKNTALSEGIGEILTPVIPLPECSILIAKPAASVSTKHVYQGLKLDEKTVHPDIDGMVEALSQGSLEEVVSRLGNVLETVTIPEHPVIARIKEKMLEDGAAGSLMSGSGPTVFGIFDDRKKAEQAYEAMKEAGLARDIYLTEPYRG